MIGERIRFVRCQLNMTQEQFARRIKCSSNFISRLERGVEKPSKKVLEMICSSFGVSNEWLLEGSGEAHLDSFLTLPREGIPSRIRQLRKEYQLTQKEFGQTVGVSASAIQSIELGKRNASENLLNVIAEKYLCGYEWLITGHEKALTEEETIRVTRICTHLREMLSDKNSDEVFLSAIKKEPEAIPYLERLVQHLSSGLG